MNPKAIASLISETPAEYGYDECPSCGNPYATVADDGIACSFKDCQYYNEDYFNVVYETERQGVRITGVAYDIMEFDWRDINILIDRGKTQNHATVDIPNSRGNMELLDIDDDEEIEVLVFWAGKKDMPPFVLRQLTIDFVFGPA